MKKLFAVCLFVLAISSVHAQELAWNTNLEKAMEISQKEKKPMFLFFTGSDWCGWCKRLEAEVFETPEFKKWAAEKVVLLEVDFPRRTPLSPELQTQNNNLQQFFGIQGYPTIWIVNVSKKEDKINFEKLGSTGYLPGGQTEWLKAANGILANKSN